MWSDVASGEHAGKLPLQPGRWFHERNAGLLLHPTALPGPGGGRLGPVAHRFVEFLAAAGFHVWQVLPLGPVNDSLSPYQPLSMLAGNPALIHPAPLVDDGLLPPDADMRRPVRELCREAHANLMRTKPPMLLNKLHEFHEGERDWLDNHALFLVLDRKLRERDWSAWPDALRRREASAMKKARKEFAADIKLEIFLQWQFHRQWQHLRHHAHRAGLRIFGDLPFYPAQHSADVWLEPELFQLDEHGRPRVTGGVPPDAFSQTGQMWGTPVYDWPAHAVGDFQWWRSRLRARLQRYDLLRLDHFRGLAAAWVIPAGSADAAAGKWLPVPGDALLNALAREAPQLELVAEDLGYITADVRDLLDAYGLPGMRVLQFAFDGGPENPHLPANVSERNVYYSGTHDNDTLYGWWNSLDDTGRSRVRESLHAHDDNDMPQPLLRAVFASRAALAIAPLQDFLGLGSEARFNRPGTATRNWRWQMNGWPDEMLAARIRDFLDDCARTTDSAA